MFSIIMLAFFVVGSGFILNSLESNYWVQSILIDVFQNDSKVQQDMSRGEATISAEEFASNAAQFAKEVLIYPFYMMVIASAFSLMGFFTITTKPYIAAGFLALAGILSLFTFIPAILLFFASSILVKSNEPSHMMSRGKTI